MTTDPDDLFGGSDDDIKDNNPIAEPGLITPNEGESWEGYMSHLMTTGALTKVEADEILKIAGGSDSITIPQELIVEEDVPEEKKKDIRAMIGEMTIPQKIKTAMFGNAVARGLLIFDPNRMIQEFVLKNPKIQITEIESFSKHPSIPQGVLRLISFHREFSKHYSIRHALVMNPKSPPDASTRWIRYLNMNDLKKVSKSKNISGAVANIAKKLVSDAEKKQRPK